MKRTPRSELRDVLARNLRLFRAEVGWSQERLAHEAGLNRTYLSAVERSEQNISVDNIARLAAAMRVDAWTLLRDKDAEAG
ncbi:helix-turn-helix domain-containing protein [Tateyamaria omphalii]|uniref:helix-turn-helix domain-containing protein n=1 Tax=Tateyamaria omphalii TaxID=299262 RepID=UPI0016728563|nr:helix-turn-helix transcriptional regulator [Tateyamaria omphalii]